MAKKKTSVKKVLSLPMRYYNTAFINKDEYKKIKELKLKLNFKSISSVITFLRENVKKSAVAGRVKNVKRK